MIGGVVRNQPINSCYAESFGYEIEKEGEFDLFDVYFFGRALRNGFLTSVFRANGFVVYTTARV